MLTTLHTICPRTHSVEKQSQIRQQCDKLLELGVIRHSTANEWSQVHADTGRREIHAQLCAAEQLYIRSRRMANYSDRCFNDSAHENQSSLEN